jgi:Flp pilus assembly pilin Flp
MPIETGSRRRWDAGNGFKQAIMNRSEYALILAAIAVVVFVTYEVMGQDIKTLVNGIDSDLTSAS